MGAVPSPFDCFLAQRSAKIFSLRMKTHGLNALAVARELQTLADKGEGVDEVVYPGLPGHPEESRSKNGLAWRMLSPHAWRWIADAVYPGRGLETSDEPPAEGLPFSGMRAPHRPHLAHVKPRRLTLVPDCQHLSHVPAPVYVG